MRLFPQSPYSKIVSRFENLRSLAPHSEEYRTELGKIIELSINELQQNPKNKKNIVLLADLFGLSALQVMFDSPDLYEYFVSLAGATIEFWGNSTLYDKNYIDGNSIRSHIQEMTDGIEDIKFWELAALGNRQNSLVSTIFTYLFEEGSIGFIKISLRQPERFGSKRLVLTEIIKLATGFSPNEMIKAALFLKYKEEIPLYTPTVEEVKAGAIIRGLEKLGITAHDFLFLYSQP